MTEQNQATKGMPDELIHATIMTILEAVASGAYKAGEVILDLGELKLVALGNGLLKAVVDGEETNIVNAAERLQELQAEPELPAEPA